MEKQTNMLNSHDLQLNYNRIEKRCQRTLNIMSTNPWSKTTSRQLDGGLNDTFCDGLNDPISLRGSIHASRKPHTLGYW